MTMPRWYSALACACVLVLAGMPQALAKFLPGPGQSTPPAQFPPISGQSGSFAPPPARPGAPARQASPFPTPGNQSVCDSFPAIRSEVEKGALAIRTAGDRKATREEVCPLFKTFAVKESRMIKFLVNNQTTCGIPAEAIKAAKTNHDKTLRIRNQVCSAAPAAAPPGPSLSDALGGPIIADDTTTKQPGRGGTFDTLTGNVLSR
jgi:hypothetical protein